MRRRVVVLVLGLVALSVVGVAFLLWTVLPKPVINHDGYIALKKGMTERDVVAMFGPPGDYRTGDVLYDGGKAEGETLESEPPTRIDEWLADDGMVQVGVDSTGRVVGKTFIVVARRANNPLVRLRRIFRW